VAILAPETVTSTNHSLEMYANGKLVGGIGSWNWSQSHQNTRVFAFGDGVVGIGSVKPQRGEPYEVVGGNLTDVAIQFSRMELWTEAWMDAFGIPEGVISLQGRPLLLKSQAPTPESGKLWSWIAYGARISQISQQDEASGDRIMRISGSMTCQTMRLICARINIPA
jgi:hypothetical protein